VFLEGQDAATLEAGEEVTLNRWGVMKASAHARVSPRLSLMSM
jgi:hypothetical protein